MQQGWRLLRPCPFADRSLHFIGSLAGTFDASSGVHFFFFSFFLLHLLHLSTFCFSILSIFSLPSCHFLFSFFFSCGFFSFSTFSFFYFSLIFSLRNFLLFSLSFCCSLSPCFFSPRFFFSFYLPFFLRSLSSFRELRAGTSQYAGNLCLMFYAFFMYFSAAL